MPLTEQQKLNFDLTGYLNETEAPMTELTLHHNEDEGYYFYHEYELEDAQQLADDLRLDGYDVKVQRHWEWYRFANGESGCRANGYEVAIQ